MAHAVETLTFRSLTARLSAAVDWLGTLGISVSRTRLGAYHRALEALSSDIGDKSEAQLREAYPDAINHLYEGNEIVTIYDALSGRGYDEFLSDKLTTLASGPISYTDEDTSANNRARNLAFELQVAARLVMSGLVLDRDFRSDVATTVGPRRFMIECKRPVTEDAVQRNVLKAKQQLKTSCRAADTVRRIGIIALDVTKFSNPAFSILTRVPPQQAAPVLSGHLEDFWRQHDRLWRQLEGSKVVGVLLRVSVMAHLLGEPMLTYCQQWTLATRPGVGAADHGTIRELSQKMETATFS